jgi:hypothetical protein
MIFEMLSQYRMRRHEEEYLGEVREKGRVKAEKGAWWRKRGKKKQGQHE